jgi:hypothetical protein
LGEFQQAAHCADAFSACTLVNPFAQVRALDQAGVKGLVGDNDGFDQG